MVRGEMIYRERREGTGEEKGSLMGCNYVLLLIT